MQISCQFLMPGGSMGPIYVLQLFVVKNDKIANKSSATKAREKITTNLESIDVRI
jgi:hypothetical protein